MTDNQRCADILGLCSNEAEEFEFDENIADAWKLVEFMRKNKFSFSLETSGFNQMFEVNFFSLQEEDKDYKATAKTAPQAITAAFLKGDGAAT